VEFNRDGGGQWAVVAPVKQALGVAEKLLGRFLAGPAL